MGYTPWSINMVFTVNIIKKREEEKMNLLSLYKLKKSEKELAKKRKGVTTKLVADIVYFRDFDVPDYFVKAYTTKDVIAQLISGNAKLDKPNLFNLSSIAMLKSTIPMKVIENYKKFIDIVRSNFKKNKLYSTNLLATMTLPVAVLTLRTNDEWKQFLKIRYDINHEFSGGAAEYNWAMVLFYLVHVMEEFSYNIPDAVLDELTTKGIQKEIRNKDAQPFSIDELDYVIKQMDEKDRFTSLEIPMVLKYWSCGGLYFPESFQFQKYLMEYGENHHITWSILDKYRTTISKENAVSSFGYYLFKYSVMLAEAIGYDEYRTINFNRNSIHPIYASPSYITQILINIDGCEAKIACYLLYDILEYDAMKDVNVFEYIFRLPLHGVALNAIKEELSSDIQTTLSDPCVKTWSGLIDLLIHDNNTVPLKDIRLYRKMFPDRFPTEQLMNSFIIQGGDVTTISKMLTKENMYMHPYYTTDGLHLIFKYVNDEQLFQMLTEDNDFVSEIEQRLFDKSLFGFVTHDHAEKLLNAIMQIPGVHYPENLERIADYLLHLLGNKPPISCIPYYINKSHIRTDQVTIKQLVQQLGREVIQDIPIQFLPIDIVKGRLHRTPGMFRKLQTETVKLDDILPMEFLDDLFFQNKNYEYIPDLTIESVRFYLSQIADQLIYSKLD